MAVKALCVMNATVGRDYNNHAHAYVGVNYAALDDSDPPIQGTHYVYDLDPALSGALLASAITAEMKTFLTGEGVTFGLLDTVRLIPGGL